MYTQWKQRNNDLIERRDRERRAIIARWNWSPEIVLADKEFHAIERCFRDILHYTYQEATDAAWWWGHRTVLNETGGPAERLPYWAPTDDPHPDNPHNTGEATQ